MECIICRRACARTMEFIILSMRKTENMVYSFDNKDDINKIKIHDCAFYGFEYKQKKSEVEIYCKNEMTKEEKIIRFRSVICIYMQSCRFWAGGIIYSACMWLMMIILRNFRTNKTRIKNYILVQGWLMEIGLFRWEWR